MREPEGSSRDGPAARLQSGVMNRRSALALACAVLLDGGCGGSVQPVGGSVQPVAEGGAGDSCSKGDATLDAVDETYADGGTLDSSAADGADSSDAAEEAPACVPKTCAELGVPCLTAQDGCGGVLNCGSCAGGGSCSASTAGPVCGPCVENCHTCSQEGFECGLAGDGNGGLVYCGECMSPSTCVAGKCVVGSDGCVPTTCIAQGAYCGTVSDGCGNTLQCGACPDGQTCGGKRPGVCGSPGSEAGL